MSESVILSARDLAFAYSAGKRVLGGISLELREGQFLALLGPNGCGKSTLLKLIAGVIERVPSRCSGSVTCRGEELFGKSPGFLARRIAYVGTDYRSEFPLTAYEAVMLARTSARRGFAEQVRPEDRHAVERAMERCLCSGWAERDLQTLSGGERQLVSLARALAQEARILFLDESLSQMDLHHQARVGALLASLAREGWSVVLVSHDVNLAAQWADSAFLMRSGERLAHGAVGDVLTTPHLKALFPDAELFVGQNPATGAPQVFFGDPAGKKV